MEDSELNIANLTSSRDAEFRISEDEEEDWEEQGDVLELTLGKGT